MRMTQGRVVTVNLTRSNNDYTKDDMLNFGSRGLHIYQVSPFAHHIEASWDSSTPAPLQVRGRRKSGNCPGMRRPLSRTPPARCTRSSAAIKKK